MCVCAFFFIIYLDEWIDLNQIEQTDDIQNKAVQPRGHKLRFAVVRAYGSRGHRLNNAGQIVQGFNQEPIFMEHHTKNRSIRIEATKAHQRNRPKTPKYRTMQLIKLV